MNITEINFDQSHCGRKQQYCYSIILNPDHPRTSSQTEWDLAGTRLVNYQVPVVYQVFVKIVLSAANQLGNFFFPYGRIKLVKKGFKNTGKTKLSSCLLNHLARV